MTQNEIDLIFNITIVMFENPWFKEKKRTRAEVQQWVADKLAESGIYTIPIGSGWGSLCTEEKYYDNKITENEAKI